MKTAIKLITSTISLFFLTQTAFSQNQDNFSPNLKIGDGSGGRIWAQWRQTARELPIESVTLSLRKVSGGGDSYVNLRFDGGQTFENGRRVYLEDGSPRSFTWDVGGLSPRGKALVLNIYKGEAILESVKINYKAPYLPPSISSGGEISKPKPIRPNLGVEGGELDQTVARECRNNYFKKPRIEIAENRSSGGLFSGKQRISGNIIGACIEEAGYFESGRLKNKFSIPYSSGYRRYEFSSQVKTGRNGEIRVYTTQGDEVRVEVDNVDNY